MMGNGSSGRRVPRTGITERGSKAFRIRRLALAAVLALGLGTGGCTPAEIEASLNRIAVSFEQGGAERGLAEAVFVAEYAIPVIEMRLRSYLGP